MKKLKKLLFALCFAVVLLTPLLGGVSLATTCDLNKPPTDQNGKPVACTCPQGYSRLKGTTNQCALKTNAVNCASGVADNSDPSGCQPLGTSNCKSSDTADQCLKKSPFTSQLNNIVNFLAAGVGMVVIAMIIAGGIQYSMAGDNQEAVGKAKTRILNAMIALVTFIFSYAILQWLIPGGL